MRSIRPYMKHVFVLTIRNAIHVKTKRVSGTLEDAQTGQEFSFGSVKELLTLVEQIVTMATSGGGPEAEKQT